jgi:hypothetical protein
MHPSLAMRTAWLAGLAVVGAAGCGGGRGYFTGVSSGAAHAVGDRDAAGDTGVELRIYMGTREPAFGAMPNVYGYTTRQIGDSKESAFAVGWQVAGSGRSSAGGFARITANLIEEDTIGDLKRLGAGGTTIEIGFAPSHAGPCASVSAGWDVRLDAPDRPILGAFLGLCVVGK